MSKEFFGDRERALENEFFHRVDRELLDRLRRQEEFERSERALAAATGIRDETVLHELVELGIGSETVWALSMLPLVRVAWADGTVQPKERQAVLQAVETIGHGPGTPGHELLRAWLDDAPDETVLKAWGDYVAALSQTLSDEARHSLKHDLLGRARSVAEAAGGILGIHAVSNSERAVLDELEAAFGDQAD